MASLSDEKDSLAWSDFFKPQTQLLHDLSHPAEPDSAGFELLARVRSGCFRSHPSPFPSLG